MKPGKLIETIQSIPVHPGMQQRLIANCMSAQAGETAGSVGRHGRSRSFKLPALAVAASMFLLAVMLLISIPYWGESGGPGQGELEWRSLLSVHVYAADSSSRNGAPVGMELNTSIVLGAYSPVMSMVPGYPFEFAHPDADIRLSVDHGRLLLWEGDQVRTAGKRHQLAEQGVIFWSPLEDDGREPAASGTLQVEVIRNGVMLLAGEIVIRKSEEPLFYTAELTAVDRYGAD